MFLPLGARFVFAGGVTLVRLGAAGALKQVDGPDPRRSVRRTGIGPGDPSDPDRAAISLAPGDGEVGLAELAGFDDERHAREQKPESAGAKYELRHISPGCDTVAVG